MGTCGGYLTDTSGELGSLDVDGDGQYEINRYCHWTIKRQDGNKLLQLKIQYMDIETGQICRSDHLKVRVINWFVDLLFYLMITSFLRLLQLSKIHNRFIFCLLFIKVFLVK